MIVRAGYIGMLLKAWKKQGNMLMFMAFASWEVDNMSCYEIIVIYDIFTAISNKWFYYLTLFINWFNMWYALLLEIVVKGGLL